MNNQSILRSALSPEAVVRQKAEQYLLNAVHNVDFVLQLLEFICDNAAENADTRMLASVTVKNALNRIWKTSIGGSNSSWSASSRTPLREAVLAVSIRAELSPKVAAHLRSAVANIARVDWPHAWPELFAQILSHLHAAAGQVGNGAGGWGALVCVAGTLNAVLKELAKKKLAVDRARYSQLAGDLLGPVASCLQASCAASVATMQAAVRACGDGSGLPPSLAIQRHEMEGPADAARKCIKIATRLMQGSIGYAAMLSLHGISICKCLSEFLPAASDAALALLGLSCGTSLNGNSMMGSSEIVDALVEGSPKPLQQCCFAIERASWACREILGSHGVSYACTGSLEPVLLWAAGQVAAGRPLLRGVLTDSLVLLSNALDISQRLNKGETPASFELEDVSQPVDTVVGTNFDWAIPGAAALHRACGIVFSPSTVDSWLGSLIGNCLQISSAELEQEWAEDSEEAAQFDTQRQQSDHPRTAAEALLCALISDAPVLAHDRVSKIFMHAQNCERSCLDAAIAGQSCGALLLQLEAAWLACGLAAADAMELVPSILHRAVFIEWCTTRLLPLAHLCGLPVLHATHGTAFHDKTADFCARLPACGLCMSSNVLEATVALRRMFWLMTACLGVLPSSRSNDPEVQSMKMVLLCLSIKALGWVARDTGAEDENLAAVRLAAGDMALAIIEDCAYADPALNSSAFAVALAQGVYNAVPALQIIDSKLQLLALLQALLKRLTAPVKVACISAMLSPLSEIWHHAASDDMVMHGGLIERSILEIVSCVVDAFPAVHPPDIRPSDESMIALLDNLVPLVSQALSSSRESFIYTLEDGLNLLQSMVEAAPGCGLSPAMCSLYTCLSAAVHDDENAEFAPAALRIATDFVLRAPTVASAYPMVFPSLMKCALGRLQPSVVPVLASSIHVCSAVMGMDGASAMVSAGLGGTMVALLSLSIHVRQKEQADKGQIRGNLMAELMGKANRISRALPDSLLSTAVPNIEGRRPQTDCDSIKLNAGCICALMLHAPAAFSQSCADWAIRNPNGLIACGAVEASSPLAAFLLSLAGLIDAGHSAQDAWTNASSATGLDASLFGRIMAVRLLVLSIDCFLWCLADMDNASASPNGSSLMGNKLMCLAVLSAAREATVQCRGINAVTGTVPTGSSNLLLHVTALIHPATVSPAYSPIAGRGDAIVAHCRAVAAALVSSGIPASGAADSLALYGLSRSPGRPGHGKTLSIGAEDRLGSKLGAEDLASREAEELSTVRSRAYLRQPEVMLDLSAALSEMTGPRHPI